MPATPTLEQARRDYEIARYDGCSQEGLDIASARLRAAEEAAETIDERCLHLGLMAASKDAEAERHMAAEADAAGRAAGRRLAGNDDEMARSFDREAVSCLELAQDASAEAERLRSQAAALRRAAVTKAHFTELFDGVSARVAMVGVGG